MTFSKVVLPQPDGPTIATNSPSRTSRLTPPTTGRSPKRLLIPSTTIFLPDIAPSHGLEPLEQAGDAVQKQSDHTDDDHAGNHEIVAVAGIAGVHDQVTQAGTQRDHLRGDDDQPGDAKADPHSDDDLGQDSRNHDLAEQHRARNTEIGCRS